MLVYLFIYLPIALVCTVGCEKPYYEIDKADQLFEDFIKSYDKVYSDEVEKLLRFEIFKSNLNIINQQNSNSEGAEFAVNNFADLTKDEFIGKYTGFRRTSATDGDECQIVIDKDITTKDAPASINWIEKGAVTAVKDQGACGSCWAFSTIGNVEGQYAIKNNKLKSFSEQELVDCSASTHGCNGGFMVDALSDLITLGGVELEDSYPYTAKDHRCYFNSTKVVAKFTSCTNYNMTDEVKFKEVVAKKGPIAIALYCIPLLFYTGGILTRKNCDSNSINHAVLIVGYGTENGTDYWLVKNSWGLSFGEKGYFRMSRGENTCGFMNSAAASADM